MEHADSVGRDDYVRTLSTLACENGCEMIHASWWFFLHTLERAGDKLSPRQQRRIGRYRRKMSRGHLSMSMMQTLSSWAEIYAGVDSLDMYDGSGKDEHYRMEGLIHSKLFRRL